MTRSLALALVLIPLLAGCGSHRRDVDRLDGDLLNSAAAVPAGKADPALTRPLADQIIVDPALARRGGGHDARPAASPGTVPLPLDRGGVPADPDRPTLGELARLHAGGGSPRPANCYAELFYSRSWAAKLPAAVPLPPDAKVSEAAGNELPGCRTRVVSYASATTPPRLAAFYVARARAAGYDPGIERRGAETVVAGDRPGDDAAFVVNLAPRADGGTDVDIVSTGSR